VVVAVEKEYQHERSHQRLYIEVVAWNGNTNRFRRSSRHGRSSCI
jgi:hypothetical protein